MQKSLLGLMFALTAVPACATDPPPGVLSDAESTARARAQAIAAICAKVPCRKASRAIALRLADGGSYTVNTSPYPYFDPGGTVILYPGDTITIGFSKTGETLNPPVLLSVRDADGAVDIGPPPPSPLSMTLSFTLNQDAGKPDMTLVATSTVSATLKYDARITLVVAGGVRTVNSNTCPLRPPQGNAPSFSGFETWPQPIGLMVIGNIRALAPGAPMTC